MRVDWCVSSWFRIKNTHSHTQVFILTDINTVAEHRTLSYDSNADNERPRARQQLILVTRISLGARLSPTRHVRSRMTTCVHGGPLV